MSEKKDNMISSNALTATSKFMSLVLRHEPERIGLVLDADGWAGVDDCWTKLHKRASRSQESCC